jgi:hypothetical protein
MKDNKSNYYKYAKSDAMIRDSIFTTNNINTTCGKNIRT